MNADPSSLTSGPLYYFLIHSGTFVLLTASIFFVLGLAFGWLTWSRHRRAVHRLNGELEGKKDEIALLKRTLAEHSSRLASEGDEEETRPSLSHRYADTPDLVLGSFLATASTVLPEAQAIKMSSPPKSETIKPPPLMIPEVIMPASTHSTLKAHPPVASNVLKSLIVGTPPLPGSEPEPEPAKQVAPPAAPATENPVAGKKQPADTSPAPDVIRLMSDPHLGLVFRARPQIIDDLSQLKGVASGIENRLNELGVYTFKQIALWNDENIVEFSRLLSFKDRIHREQWVDQARELHFHTYNERV
jgi:predicted flap endonuclease-1-like 5' DNA nuclease